MSEHTREKRGKIAIRLRHTHPLVAQVARIEARGERTTPRHAPAVTRPNGPAQ